ncbi:MAG: hypothetical protein GXX90_00190 [Microbacteriaceae bacterium]|nr:hypothetical protein [Microbacteriaceae bacterium]
MRWVGTSSVLAGIAGYVVILLASRALGAERFAAFFIVWALFFTIAGTIGGLMQETARGVRAKLARDTDRPIVDENDNGIDDADEIVVSEGPTGTSVIELVSREELAADQRRRLLPRGSHRVAAASVLPGALPIRVATGMGLLVAGLSVLASPLWGPLLLPAEHWLVGTALIAVSIVLLSVQGAVAGMLSGTGRWRGYGALIAAEALLRIVAAAIAAASGAPLLGFILAAAAGLVITPIILLGTPVGREMLHRRTDVPNDDFVRRGFSASAVASAPTLFVVGFPVLLALVRPGIEPLVLSNLLIGVLLVRAVTLTPMASFQNALVVYSAARLDRGRRALIVPFAGIALVGLVLAFFAWVLGTPVIEFMGEGFTLSGEVLAVLTLGGALTAALYVTGTATLARDRHRHYVIGWWLAALVAALVLVVVPQPVAAVELALVLGPIAGLVYHLVAGVQGTGDVAHDADPLGPPTAANAVHPTGVAPVVVDPGARPGAGAARPGSATDPAVRDRRLRDATTASAPAADRAAPAPADPAAGEHRIPEPATGADRIPPAADPVQEA